MDISTADSENSKGEREIPGQALRRESTNRLFIGKNHGICDGSPIIEGARTRVIGIVIEYEMLGCSPDEIISSHPYLNLPQVHNPLSFITRTATSLIRRLSEITSSSPG